MKKKINLTLKEQKFLENYIKNGGNRAKAVIDAGYEIGSKGGNPKNTKTIASTIGANILTKMEKDKKLRDILADYGITQDLILDKFKMLLNSTDQRVVYQILDLYMKLKGEYADPKLRIGKLEDLDDILTETDISDQKVVQTRKLNNIEESTGLNENLTSIPGEESE